MARISMVYCTDVWTAECKHSSMDRSVLFSWKVVGSNPGWYYIHSFLRLTRQLIFGKTTINKFLVAKNTDFCCALNAGLLLFKPGATSARLFGFVTTLQKRKKKEKMKYEFFWVFNPENIFLVDFYRVRGDVIGPPGVGCLITKPLRKIVPTKYKLWHGGKLGPSWVRPWLTRSIV